MKIKKVNELTDYSDYKEYDEYSNLNIDVINDWNKNLSEINIFLSNLFHELHQYKDFSKEFVICDNKDVVIIPSDIKINYSDKFKVYFFDTHTNTIIEATKIKYIKNIKEVADTDQKLFLELYDKYIKKYNAPYMDVFGRDEFKYIINTIKYNI